MYVLQRTPIEGEAIEIVKQLGHIFILAFFVISIMCDISIK